MLDFLATRCGAIDFQGEPGGVEDRFDLRDRHSCEDADQKLASESFSYCGATEARFQILRLAAEKDRVGGLNGAEILALKNRDGDWVG